MPKRDNARPRLQRGQLTGKISAYISALISCINTQKIIQIRWNIPFTEVYFIIRHINDNHTKLVF